MDYVTYMRWLLAYMRIVLHYLEPFVLTERTKPISEMNSRENDEGPASFAGPILKEDPRER